MSSQISAYGRPACSRNCLIKGPSCSYPSSKEKLTPSIMPQPAYRRCLVHHPCASHLGHSTYKWIIRTYTAVYTPSYKTIFRGNLVSNRNPLPLEKGPLVSAAYDNRRHQSTCWTTSPSFPKSAAFDPPLLPQSLLYASVLWTPP